MNRIIKNSRVEKEKYFDISVDSSMQYLFQTVLVEAYLYTIRLYSWYKHFKQIYERVWFPRFRD